MLITSVLKICLKWLFSLGQKMLVGNTALEVSSTVGVAETRRDHIR